MTVERVLEGLQKFELDRQSHTGSGLVLHLRGTHRILAGWGCPEALCLGGLCHSVYGTESYRHQTITLRDRSTVRELIGEDAEKIAYLFGAHIKDTLWENLERDPAEFEIGDRFTERVAEITEVDFGNLVTLTLGNWLEQRPRAGKEYQFLRQEEFLAAEAYLPTSAFVDFKTAYGL